MKRAKDLDWNSVQEGLTTALFDSSMKRDEASVRREVAQSREEVNAEIVAASVQDLKVELQLTLNADEVAPNPTEPERVLNLSEVSVNGHPLTDLRVSLSAPPPGKRDLALSLSGFVAPDAASLLQSSSMLTLRARLEDARRLEAHGRR